MRAGVLLVAVVLASLLLTPAAGAALRFKRCGDFGFRCARLSVPLDRSGAVPGRVSLIVTRVRARQRGGATLPPLFLLAGGPGQSATDAFSGALGLLYPAYAKRDLIVFDQRGTGRSGLIRCRRLERSNLLRAGAPAAACARSLGRRRAFYTSRDSADDIEAIRKALGAERVALFGTSYGTKLALGYAKLHPDRVERLVLDSVVELNGPDPLYWTPSRRPGAPCGRSARGAARGPRIRARTRPRWSAASRARARCADGPWTCSAGPGP